MFILDPKLQADTFFIHDFPLSRLLLMNDKNYPWLILVPKKPNLVELIDLSRAEQELLLQEINLVAKILKEKFAADKLNIANLGNMVRQLHVHVIARFKDDAAFPRPVWGAVEAVAYGEGEVMQLIERIRSFLI